MQSRIMAIGSQPVAQRIAATLAGSDLEIICLSEVSEAIALLKQEKFGVVLVDACSNDVESTCTRIIWLCRTPVIAVIKGDQPDAGELRFLDADGFVSQEANSTELISKIRAVARHSSHFFSKAKILVVEDDEQIRETLALTFRIYWPEVEIYQACSGGEGITTARNEPMDAILLDLGLPDISGFEVLTQIRTFSLTPIIMLTAARDEENVVKAMKLGADDYLVKPFKQGELMSRIRRHVEPALVNSRIAV